MYTNSTCYFLSRLAKSKLPPFIIFWWCCWLTKVFQQQNIAMFILYAISPPQFNMGICTSVTNPIEFYTRPMREWFFLSKYPFALTMRLPVFTIALNCHHHGHCWLIEGKPSMCPILTHLWKTAIVWLCSKI